MAKVVYCLSLFVALASATTSSPTPISSSLPSPSPPPPPLPQKIQEQATFNLRLRFDQKVVESFRSVNPKKKVISLDECHQLIDTLFPKISPACIPWVWKPSKSTVLSLLSKDARTKKSVSPADFVNLARDVRQRTWRLWRYTLIAPLFLRLWLATQVSNDFWLSLDLTLADFFDSTVHKLFFVPSNFQLSVINAQDIVHQILKYTFFGLLVNGLLRNYYTMMWLGEEEGKETITTPPVPPTQIIPESSTSKSTTPEPKSIIPPPPLPSQPAVSTQSKSKEADLDIKAYAAPLLVASALGTAFSLDIPSSHSSSTSKSKQRKDQAGSKHTAARAFPVVATKGNTATKTKPPPPPPRATTENKKKAGTTSGKSTSKGNKKENDEDAQNKTPVVQKIAVGSAVVGCLKYAATVARFVGVFLP
jgi:hypothetical protein